ncbi:hypothetical protein [Streptomyces flavidovirens]|uniref:hypothetical protein n=1 Tax=Streptomyces flavidovirens TaxID=67298 RepID=UPI0012FEF8F5|nr:hypothetical protein [Streptomyces flavidovirens]
METSFKYRLRSPVGGLAANLTARTLVSTPPADHSLRIHQQVWLSHPIGGLYWKDAAWLSFGLALHAEILASRYPEGLGIQVVSLQAPLSDYRSEVAALAMDGWLRAEFDLPAAGVEVTFREADGEYIFHWGNIESPFADRP